MLHEHAVLASSSLPPPFFFIYPCQQILRITFGKAGFFPSQERVNRKILFIDFHQHVSIVIDFLQLTAGDTFQSW